MSSSTVPDLKKLLFLPFIVIFMLVAACVKDNFDLDRLSGRVLYNPSFVLPIAYGNITLGNLLEPDDSTVIFNPDNSIRLVIREDSVFSVSVNDILEIPLPDPVSETFRTDPIKMGDFSTHASISLGEITGRIYEPEASFIRGSDGSTVHFPAIPRQYLGNLTPGVLEDIEYAHFTAGWLELAAHNNLPVEVSMEVILINEPDHSEVGRFIFEDIAPGQSATQGTGLEGIMVRESMTLEILAFSTSSSNSDAQIDLSDEIEFDITAKDLMASKGRARLEKTLLDSGSALRDLHFDEEVVLDELSIEEGFIHYSLDNYSHGLTLGVSLVNLTSEQGPFTFNISPGRGGNIFEGAEKLSDVDFDFSEYNNQLLIEFTVFVGSDDKEMVEFDLYREVMDFNMHFSDLSVGYASGYFGQNEFDLDIDDIDLDFDLFNKITGDFRLTNPSASIFYTNSAGVPTGLMLNMNAGSHDGSRQADLFDGEFRTFSIDTPIDPLNPVQGEFLINRETSNIVDFIALPPRVMQTRVRALINPDGPTGIPNFIDSKSSALMGIVFELPLEMQLTDLRLVDTVSLKIDPDDIDFIEILLMTLQVTNAFPLAATIDLELYDSKTDRVIYNFEELVLMEAASLDNNGAVVAGGEARTEAEVEISKNVADHLKQADHMIISARFNTGKNSDVQLPVRLLTTDRLDFTIRLKAGLSTGN